ncbi:MAG: DNA double-strand break repair nuclease NurA, partial [Anaerolineae bacterium]|nr:DNA double-strand break repair nuclease NurA [Anaerolineae bacterium]
MPVNFLNLKPQIQALAETAVSHRSEMAQKLAACQALLSQYSDQQKELQEIVENRASKNKGLRCAVPVSEPLMAHNSAALPAPACTILAADGSQINPDPHGSVLYGLVNVGVFRMQPGSGLAPEIKTFSNLLYDEDLHPSGGLASEDLIALMRDVHEREILADLAQNEAAPLVTLTDGPLELYHEPRQEKAFEHYFKQYLAALDDLALNQVITAGYVDRPRADLVVKLLELVAPEDESADRPFAGVTDLQLFESILNPGERSAVFKLQSSSADAFANKKALHFFYINVGSVGQPALARVEVPLWVVEDPHAMSLLQSVLVEQSHQAGSRPYPYPLIRAHEIAVVKMDDHNQISEMIEQELLNRGLPPTLNSNKQSHKQHQ